MSGHAVVCRYLYLDEASVHCLVIHGDGNGMDVACSPPPPPPPREVLERGGGPGPKGLCTKNGPTGFFRW